MEGLQRVLTSLLIVGLVLTLAYAYREPAPIIHQQAGPSALPPQPFAAARPDDGLNLLWPSEDLTSPRWRIDSLVIKNHVDIAPDGTHDADAVIEKPEPTAHRVETSVGGVRPGSNYDVSLFVRPALRYGLMFEMRDSKMGRYGWVKFDLRVPTSIEKSGDALDAGIERIAGGWFRCWATMHFDTDQTVVDFALMNPAGQTTYLGALKGMLMWGAQVAPGAAPAPYMATTTEPASPR
jgi:hypothetical protein